MASYTNLGLIEPGPLDPATNNVWGPLINSDMALIDSAVSGILALSLAGVSTNQVLTFNNGAADQQRNWHFAYSGALAGAVTILYPAGRTKQFSVTNSCTGFALSIGVSNGSGGAAGTTVTVPSGGSLALSSDGTNITQRVNAAGLNVPSLSGTNVFTGSNSFVNNQNGDTIVLVSNNSGGAAARALWQANNGLTATDLFHTGVGYTTSFPYRQDAGILVSGGSGGLVIGTLSSASMYFALAGLSVGQWSSSGGLLATTQVNGSNGIISDNPGGNVSWDANAAQTALITFSGSSNNRTMNAPSNLMTGGTYILEMTQGGGNNTVTWNSVFSFNGASSLSTAAGAVDVFSGVYTGTKLRGSIQKGFT